jgi:hypothetical protein
MAFSHARRPPPVEFREYLAQRLYIGRKADDLKFAAHWYQA